MKKSSLEKKESDSVDRTDKSFERYLLYSRTSKSHKIDLNEAFDSYNFVDENPFDRFDLDSDGLTNSKPERRPRVSFSSMDDVKVFYPNPAEIKIPSKKKLSRWTIEDNIMRIGETAMYMGRLNKIVDVMSPITDVSPRSPILSSKSPDIISVRDRNPEERQARKISRTRLTGGKNKSLPPLTKVHHRRKECVEGNEMAAGRSTSCRKSKQISPSGSATSWDANIERQRREKNLPRKSPKNNAIRTKIGYAAITQKTVTKLPEIIPSKSCNRKQYSHKNLDEKQNVQRVKLPFLPHPPNQPRKGERRRIKA